MSNVDEVEILLVEDDPADAELALRAFEKQNLSNKVFLVSDGESALDFVFARGPYESRSPGKPPKVVLLDLKLPKVDGREVLRQIRSDERTRTLPVVVLTSSKEESDLIETYKLGVNSYIVKPVDFDGFLAAVAQLGMYWLLLNTPPLTRI